MNRKNYIHIGQDEAFEQYRQGVAFQEDAEKVYEEIDYKIRRPDLLGKTVRVTEKQFPRVNTMLREMTEREGIPAPAVYVYDLNP